ncbi:putative uncharacterized protein DDB_G0282133 isoform X2 [Spodoptera frugiperda]|uniref:Uncharacterized protein n=1 Tax=Spodoptera frugiperda TaxID=7108 RepID=A0A9R0DYY2_SPOFR|nr:putative uncharacterized protein DDB_G0282133 isoform X2 [Spodoptera frugiperda]
MKNINTCILFIIIGNFNHRIGIHAKNETDLTEDYFEQEARRDVEKLLAKIKSLRNDSNINNDKENKTPQRLIDKNIKKIKPLRKSIFGNGARRSMPNDPNAHDQNQVYNIMYQLSQGNPVKKVRMKNGEIVPDSLRKSYMNVKPEIYPADNTSNERDDQEETVLEVDNGNNVRYSRNENEFENIMRSSNNGNTFQAYEPARARSYLPLSANLENFNNLFHRFNRNGHKNVRNRPEKEESGTNDHNPYLRSNSPMSERDKEVLDATNDDSNENNPKRTKVTVLRTDVSDEAMYADINDQIDEFVNNFNDDKNENNMQRTVKYTEDQDAQPNDENRTRRAARTQAGYTQDPDTCKTYNENLVKLWSNLSKYLNVTEQPDELALHNIAMMVQAYLEHHTPQSPESYKSKHEGPRDKVTQIILRIRKTLEDSQASEAKIVKIIKKYAKPFYGDVENEDCQLTNEEYLQTSVGLLFKHYLDNIECYGDDHESAMNKRLILRHTKNRYLIRPRNGPVLITNDDYFKPDNGIYIDGEVYKDFQKGKIPGDRSSRNRRGSELDRNPQHQAPSRRSGIGNDKTRLIDRTFTRYRNNNVKSDGTKTKSRCERNAIRKLTSGLRPVIERFSLLQECQIDNTLRSQYDYPNSHSPYYLYASRYFSDDNEENHHYRKPLPIDRLTRKNTERSKLLESPKQDFEKEDFVRDDGDTWIRKQSNSNVKRSDVKDRTAETATENHNTNNDFQSPPIYDDYDGLFKTPPLIRNPLSSVINIKKIIDKVNNKTTHTKDKDKENKALTHRKHASTTSKPERYIDDDKGIDYDYSNESEHSNENINPSVENDNHSADIIEEPFQDLTRLRSSDNVFQEKKNTRTYESLSEFIKKARDVSLRTPEVTMPFALDDSKGNLWEIIYRMLLKTLRN